MEQHTELIHKAQAGDKHAFGLLYKEYYQRIYRYCRINVYKHAIAEDICQETFLRAWKALPKFAVTAEGTFQAFLFRIARNVIIDASRKKKEVPLGEHEDIEIEEDHAAEIDKAMSIEHVRKALATLSEKDRQILILRYFEDMSHAEVATIIGIREGALRVRTIRLLHKLKELLKKS